MCLAWLRGRFWKVLCSREHPVCSACGVQGVCTEERESWILCLSSLKQTNKKTGSVYSVVLTDQMTFFSMAPAHNFSRKRKVSSQVYGVGGGLEVTAGRGEQSSGPQISVFPFSVMGDARRGALEPLSRAVIKKLGTERQ